MLKLINNLLPKRIRNNKGFLGGLLAAAAPSLIGAGAGMLGGLLDSKSGEGQVGYDLPTMQNSPWDFDNQQMSSQFAQNNLLRTQAGQLPEGMELLLDRIRKNQLLQSQQEMFGMPGARGGSIMDSVASMGAMTGVGPKATMSQGQKAMNDYASRNSQISNYIDSLKYSGLQNAQNSAISDIQSLPRSMELPWTGQAVGYNNSAPQTNYAGMFGGFDYSGIGKLFQPSQQTTTSYSPQISGSTQQTYGNLIKNNLTDPYGLKGN